MKCFVHLYKLGGGAPKSIYEYLRILKSKGASILCVASPSEDSVYDLYKTSFGEPILRTSFIQLCAKKKFIKAILELYFEIKTIKNEKPDLVMVQGEIDGFFYSYFCKKLNIPLIIMIAGGDLSPNRYIVEKWIPYGDVICFSEENKDELMHSFPESAIHVISNRITISNKFSDISTHYRDLNSINVLIVSRIVASKVQSIYEFLDQLSRLEFRKAINIRIAGTGNAFDQFSEIVNDTYGDKLNITLLGHVDNLYPEFEWAHIVVGKGRSVIEPIMMNRIGCVIGEDGKSSICTQKSFDNLYHYNFAGRNITATLDENRFDKTILSLLEGTYDVNMLLESTAVVDKHYSAEYLESAFMKVIEGKKSAYSGKSVNLLSRCLEFFKIRILHRLKRNDDI